MKTQLWAHQNSSEANLLYLASFLYCTFHPISPNTRPKFLSPFLDFPPNIWEIPEITFNYVMFDYKIDVIYYHEFYVHFNIIIFFCHHTPSYWGGEIETRVKYVYLVTIRILCHPPVGSGNRKLDWEKLSIALKTRFNHIILWWDVFFHVFGE